MSVRGRRPDHPKTSSRALGHVSWPSFVFFSGAAGRDYPLSIAKGQYSVIRFRRSVGGQHTPPGTWDSRQETGNVKCVHVRFSSVCVWGSGGNSQILSDGHPAKLGRMRLGDRPRPVGGRARPSPILGIVCIRPMPRPFCKGFGGCLLRAVGSHAHQASRQYLQGLVCAYFGRGPRWMGSTTPSPGLPLFGRLCLVLSVRFFPKAIDRCHVFGTTFSIDTVIFVLVSVFSRRLSVGALRLCPACPSEAHRLRVCGGEQSSSTQMTRPSS